MPLPELPVEPVNAMEKLNVLSMTMSEPICTGMVTFPADVTEVDTEMVTVGEVVLVSTLTVTPLGAVISDVTTLHATCVAPCNATTCVVVLPALAALVVPGKAYASDVSITEYASVTSTMVT